MLPPRDWIEKWAYQNPKQALAICAFGIAMVVFTVWLTCTPP